MADIGGVTAPGPTKAKPRKGRKQKLSRPGGPSRLHNKRQQKIVKLVDGYDSSVTLAAVVRNVLLAWIPAGLVLVGTGIAELDPVRSDIAGLEIARLGDAARSGLGLLFVLTVVVVLAWVTRSRMNVKHLGKSPKVGLWKRIKTHVLALLFGIAALVGTIIAPALAPILVVAGIALIFYAQLWFHLLMFDVVRMLWRTASPATGQEEDVPHYAFVWLVGWISFVGLLGLGDVRVDRLEVGGFVSIGAGLACIATAATGAMLAPAISRRQEDRLQSIIGGVEDDDDRSQKPVTTSQINDAWSASEGLIDLPGHH